MFYIFRNSFIIVTGSTIWHRIASVLHYRWKEGSSSPSYVNSGETVGFPYWVGVPSSDISSAGSPFFFCGGSKHEDCSGKKAALHPGSTLAESGVPHIGLGCRVPYSFCWVPICISMVLEDCTAVERSQLSISGQPWRTRGFPIFSWGAGSHIKLNPPHKLQFSTNCSV